MSKIKCALPAGTSWAQNPDKLDIDGLNRINNTKFHSIYQKHPDGRSYLHQRWARICTIGIAIWSLIPWVDRLTGGTGA